MDIGFGFIHQLAGSSKILDALAIFLGEYLPFIFVIFFVIALFTLNHWRERISLLLFTGFSLLVSWGVIDAMRYLFPMERPFVAGGFTPLFLPVGSPSFPSGHATFFFTLATVIFLQMSARWGIVSYLAVILIGLGRVFAGVHYPVDIAAGLVIGLIVPLFVRMIMPKPAPYDSPAQENEMTTSDTA